MAFAMICLFVDKSQAIRYGSSTKCPSSITLRAPGQRNVAVLSFDLSLDLLLVLPGYEICFLGIIIKNECLQEFFQSSRFDTS